MAISTVNGVILSLVTVGSVVAQLRMSARLLIALTELVCGCIGVMMVCCTKCFVEVFGWESMDQRSEIYFKLFGTFICSASILSFLTRRSTNDESVIRNLVSMWTKHFAVASVHAVNYVIKFGMKQVDAAGKGAGKDAKSSEFDLNNIPLIGLLIQLLVIGTFISYIIQTIRWPAFRSQVAMSTDNQTNLNLYIEEMACYTSGLILLFLPVLKESYSGFSMTFSVIILLGGNLAHDCQYYFNDKDKTPLFWSFIFITIVQMIVLGIHKVKYPDAKDNIGLLVDDSHLILQFIIMSIGLSNRILGILTARKSGKQKRF